MTALAENRVEADEMADGHPERTCVGCRAHDESAVLIRLAHVPGHEPALVPDLGGKLGGRGLWLHPRTACLDKALRGGFARALRAAVSLDREVLLTTLRTQLTRRIQGLLLAALRRGSFKLGTDSVLEALATCPVSLLLVAKDAAGRRNDIVARASERRVPVVELFDREVLGRLTQRDAVSFLAVLDNQIAREIADASRWLAGLSEDG